MLKGFICRISVLLLCVPLYAAAANLQVDLLDQAGKPLEDAVVTLQGGGARTSPATATMDQHNKEFAPHVLAVRTGTQVSFPNSDNIRHQVYSFSPPKRFELRLYQGTPSEPVTLDKAGVVVLGCNIHDWMLGYIYVTDDPWFAVTDSKGHLQFDLPPGHYTVTLWHPQTQDMAASSGGTLDVPAAGLQKRFSLTVQPREEGSYAEPPESDFGNAFDKAAHDTAH